MKDWESLLVGIALGLTAIVVAVVIIGLTHHDGGSSLKVHCGHGIERVVNGTDVWCR